jgi:hypothetical protein
MRIALVRNRWDPQDGLLLAYMRQVEEHCRMLAGQQWDVWSEALGRFVDVTAFFTDEEKVWRQRPVVNLVLYWYMLTHARLTENPPIITFQPATADRLDAELAETLDTVFKTLWADAHMPEIMDRLLAWVIVAGTAYIKSYPDFEKGSASVSNVGPAHAMLPDQTTGDLVPHEVDGVPYDAQGQPQFELQPHPDDPTQLVAVPTADPYEEKDGGITACVLNPLQVRSEWTQKPWDEKRWHIHRDYFSPSDVQSRYGVEVQPDTAVAGNNAGPGYLERLLFNAGHYGAVDGGGVGTLGNPVFGQGTAPADGFVCVDEMWEKPCQENEGQGRLLIVTKSHVLYDGPNPFPKLKGPSPIRRFDFVGVPGRPAGTTPLEMLVPIQRAYNRMEAQEAEHNSLMTNPMILADDASGLDDDAFVSAPGQIVMGGLRNGQPMIAAFQPPPLSPDFWRRKQALRDTFMFLGNVTGTEGSAPTEDASGELVTQLRANADRFIGPTARKMVTEIGRMAEDWVAIVSVLWTEPKILSYAGDDQLPQTISVYPEMWEGNVHAVPDVESMLPEGRGEKQARVYQLWKDGWFGNPLDPGTTQKVAPLLRFPNLNRAAMPGGIDASTANQNLGALLLGTPSEGIPLFDAYDFQVHLTITNQYIASPEFKRCDPQVQQQVELHAQRLEQLGAMKLVQNAKKAQAVQMASMPPMLNAPGGPGASHGTPGPDSGPAGPDTPANPNSVTPAPLRASPELH